MNDSVLDILVYFNLCYYIVVVFVWCKVLIYKFVFLEIE